MNLTMKYLYLLLTVHWLTKDRHVLISASKGLPSLSKCGKVHITISSLTGNFLELNWITNCNTSEAPDKIGLYNRDPKTAEKPLQLINARNHNGYFKTSVKFGSTGLLPTEWHYNKNSTSRMNPGPKCYKFWAASIRKNKIIDSNCLKIRPTWMEDNRAVLGPQRIGSLFIPGTHNSGASGDHQGIFVDKYFYNQNTNIYAQLVFGIRYLDLRVGYYEDKGFFINHDLLQLSPLEPHLKLIRHFVKLAPKEVIIVDIHRLPYPDVFRVGMHKKLIALIQKELGDVALASSGLQGGKGPTLNDIWQRNKSLIICYPDRQMTKENPWLWSPMPQYWGDKQKMADLKNYLYGTIKNRNSLSPPLWALMAELTITPLDVIFGSTRNTILADEVNRHLTVWFREEWYQEVNIVATDYFQGNNLIEIAIEANKIK